MPRAIALTQEQITYLVDQVNAAGAQESPPFVYVSHDAWNTQLHMKVQAQDGSGFTMPERVNAKNGWEADPEEFKRTVAHIIHEADKDWGPF